MARIERMTGLLDTQLASHERGLAELREWFKNGTAVFRMGTAAQKQGFYCEICAIDSAEGENMRKCGTDPVLKKRVGRPRIGIQNAKGKLFAARFTSDEAKRLTAAIRQSKLTKSDWLRNALLSACGQATVSQ